MQRKIFINLFIILLIGIIVSGFMSYNIIKSTYSKGVEDKLISNTYLTKEIISERIKITGFDDLNEYAKSINNFVGNRITVIGAKGQVFADTNEDIAMMENHMERPEVKTALNGGTGLEKRFSSTKKTFYIYCAMPIYDGNNIKAVVRLSIPLKEIQQIMLKHLYNLLIAFGLGLVIASFIGYNAAKRITKPIKEITNMSQEISNGKYQNRLVLEGKDEIAKLAESINNMAKQLQQTISRLNDRNKEMEAVLNSVENGIIAIDNNERVFIMNPYAVKLLNIEDAEVEGKHIIYVVRNQQLDEYIRKTIKSKTFEEYEITLNYPEERIIKINSNPIKNYDRDENMGIIITFQDMTEIRKLEKLRSDFVANVSHELKTPLTSIKGFVETLKGGAIKDEKAAMHFLDIIELESERLTSLISDILILSEMENKKEKTTLEKFEIESSIDEIIEVLHSQAEKKNIEIVKNVDKGMGWLYGSQDKFKQMLINIVDNGVKYSPEKSKIIIHGYLEDGKKVIEVQDFGIGISKEHIPRLFERFYRIDKARSRNIGGTGLGLAIVKHIAISFHAEIEIESEINKGTKFIIKFPDKV